MNARFLRAAAAICTAAWCWTAVAAGDDVSASRRNAIVRAVERVAPAVCSINVIQLERSHVFDPFTREFWDFFGFQPFRGHIQGREIESMGSGFVMGENGLIVTNSHVLEEADIISSVTLADGRELEVEYLGGDRRSDVAVLKAKEEGLPHVTVGDSDSLMTGEWVVALGNPFGGYMSDPQPTASIGIVSANHRRVSRVIGEGRRYYQDMIQTDAAINPGNSGGPLCIATGEVVGVNTMILSENGGNIGLGFALPINRVRRVVDEIAGFGRVRNTWPGFRAEAVAALRGHVLRELDVRTERGCLVLDIRRDAPAYEAGLRPGDVILAVNGQQVDNPEDIDFIMWGLFVGDEVTLDLDRQGASRQVTFEAAEIPE